MVSLYEAGVPAGSDYNTASNTSLITGDNSTFASDTGYWTKVGGTTIGSGVATIPTLGTLGKTSLLTAGKKYRLTFTATLSSTTLTVNNGLVTYATAAAGANSFEFTAATNGTLNFTSVGGTATVDDVLLYPLGLLLAPDAGQAGGGLTWYDTSGNAANITWTSGVTWNVPFAGYLTAPASTNLTLAGGSTGASLVLSQGTNGVATLKSLGTGRTVISSALGASTPTVAIYNDTANTRSTLGIVGNGGSSQAAIQFGYGSPTSITNTGNIFCSLTDFQINTAGSISFGSTSPAEWGRFAATTGNFLLKSDGVDSGNGKLQLTSHTTSAGGIGFGTDLSVFRSTSGSNQSISTVGTFAQGSGGQLLNIIGCSGTGRRVGFGLADSTGLRWSLLMDPADTNILDLGIVRGNTRAFRIQDGAYSASTWSLDLTPDKFSVNATTASSSTTTGALVVSGGVGVAGVVSAGGGIRGTATNDNAAAGIVGEYVSSTVAYASRISLTTATPANITSISLTAGDWDVTGIVVIGLNSATCTAMASSINSTGGTVGALGEYSQSNPNTTTASFQYFNVTPTVRFSLSSTTTVYLVGSATFSAGTVDGFGTIRARRVR